MTHEICRMCEGTGGACYVRKGEASTDATTVCRACRGKGIVWPPVCAKCGCKPVNAGRLNPQWKTASGEHVFEVEELTT